MSLHACAELALYLGALMLLAPPLGRYLARVYVGEARFAQRVLGPLERLCYRLGGVRPAEEMSWRRYALALLLFNLAGLVALYALQRLQGLLPLNPAGLPGVQHGLAWNTAVSFVTNTNWQAYGGETTLSHLTQLVGLTTQNFVSAATGMAVAVALLRGFVRRQADTVGNFWVDLTRSTLYVLLPLAALLALLLVAQGVVQTLAASTKVQLLEPAALGTGGTVTDQFLALGPAASQVAIKQLGTNGGGFFNANSAHPFENPTWLSNFLQMLSILLLPAAFCFAFGVLVGDRRQGWALFAAMSVILVPLLFSTVALEQAANPALADLGVAAQLDPTQAGGHMEGKEVRFGPVSSAIWATATTAASNGSVNAMHDSFSPLGGAIPLWLIQLGEIVFGGVGSGLYGLLLYAVVAVFIAGLMVGRTPEYLGKKIEAHEMKMGAIGILLPSAAVLIATAVATLVPAGFRAVGNPGPHGFSELLYAFSSAANNNGSAFGGLAVNSTFYNLGTGICMLVGRYGVIIPVLALAGSLARKKIVPVSAGTLPTHTPLFVLLLIGTILLVGALTFLPALGLGPLVEHLSQKGG